jgi:hypothetical protein
MFSKIITVVALICCFITASAQINLNKLKEKAKSITQGSTTLSESEIVQGLKEALTVGAKNASTQLNKQDGFFKNPLVKIPFPEDAKNVASKLRELGFGKKVDEFELAMNRAAEDASKEAAGIFVNAITSMSITDAKSILTGADSAATVYLKGKTTDQLTSAFSPPIKKALDAASATKLWTEITTIYNKIPFVKKVETDLTKYTTTKALKGLFTVVASEEKKIRTDASARVTDILKKVFGK